MSNEQKSQVRIRIQPAASKWADVDIASAAIMMSREFRRVPPETIARALGRASRDVRPDDGVGKLIEAARLALSEEVLLPKN